MNLVQVGWRSKLTGEICDCPLGETSPHANSEPVYRVESASEEQPQTTSMSDDTLRAEGTHEQ